MRDSHQGRGQLLAVTCLIDPCDRHGLADGSAVEPYRVANPERAVDIDDNRSKGELRPCALERCGGRRCYGDEPVVELVVVVFTDPEGAALAHDVAMLGIDEPLRRYVETKDTDPAVAVWKLRVAARRLTAWCVPKPKGVTDLVH